MRSRGLSTAGVSRKDFSSQALFNLLQVLTPTSSMLVSVAFPLSLTCDQMLVGGLDTVVYCCTSPTVRLKSHFD